MDAASEAVESLRAIASQLAGIQSELNDIGDSLVLTAMIQGGVDQETALVRLKAMFERRNV